MTGPGAGKGGKADALVCANDDAGKGSSGAELGSPGATCDLGQIDVVVASIEKKAKPDKKIQVSLSGAESRSKELEIEVPGSFVDLHPGDYMVEAKVEGWEQIASVPVALPTAGHETAKVEIEKLWIVNITGKLFWNRTWDYKDETKPIGAIKEYLPGAKVTLLRKKKTDPDWTEHATVELTDGETKALNVPSKNTGKFLFKDVPEKESEELRIKVTLEYKGGRIVCVKGKKYKGIDKVVDTDFLHIKTGELVWGAFDLDPAKVFIEQDDVDLGDVEIPSTPGSEITSTDTAKTDFVHLCDAYKTTWIGHERIFEMADKDLPICQINYPEDESKTVSNAGKQMQICKLDLLDRAVLLHEYGHFIGDNVLGGLTHYGYTYQHTAAAPTFSHDPESTEHYEDAWVEGHATFLSCALMDDEHYHDGYDTTLDIHVGKPDILIGPHCEGSIQQALWRIYKHHKTDFKKGFWKAFTDTSKRKCETIFDFFNNWKDLGLSDLDKVVESMKTLNMEYGYDYSDSFDCIAQKKVAGKDVDSFSEAKKEFATVAELHANLGRTGKDVEYHTEFFNRNKLTKPNPMPATSKWNAATVTKAKKYIAPRSFQVKP